MEKKDWETFPSSIPFGIMKGGKMAKEIEYEDEDEMPQDLSDEDELDFDDEKTAKKMPEKKAIQASASASPAQIKSVKAQAQPQPVKEMAKEKPNEQNEPTQTEEISPEMQAQIFMQNLVATIEELNARITKIESDLYRQR